MPKPKSTSVIQIPRSWERGISQLVFHGAMTPTQMRQLAAKMFRLADMADLTRIETEESKETPHAPPPKT